MAYPKALNDLYKSEKAAGITSAKSFPEWKKAYDLNQQTVEEANSSTEVFAGPTIDEVLNIVKASIVVVEAKLVETKADIARRVYDDFEAKNTPFVRKDVINAFMTVAGLSKKGASTYYQNIRRSKGLISA